jgi:hypothetical protein
MTVRYTIFSARTGKDTQYERNVASIKDWDSKSRQITLENGQSIFIEPIRSEIYGKGGKYLAIIDNIELITTPSPNQTEVTQ